MLGEQKKLRDWLIITGIYDYSDEDLSDRELVEYIRQYKGNVLEEV